MGSINKKISTSIIIPTYNKGSRLIVTLESLKKLKLSDYLEVIIVNDGSGDDTQDILVKFNDDMLYSEKINVQILKTENAGRSVARNRGIEAAGGELIIFSDDDLILDSMFVLQHEEMHRKYKNAVIHGKINSLPYLKFFKSPMSPELMDGGLAAGLI
jgi:glycosyltransferase involved in cell wall biosynthesis